MLEERDGKTLYTCHVLHKTAAGGDGHIASGVEVGASIAFDRLEELARSLAIDRRSAGHSRPAPPRGHDRGERGQRRRIDPSCFATGSPISSRDSASVSATGREHRRQIPRMTGLSERKRCDESECTVAETTVCWPLPAR
jgi:hypothetical protein